MNGEIWRRARLKDVVDSWIIGSTPPRTRPECFAKEGGIPWAKAEDVRGGILNRTAEQLTPLGGEGMQLVDEGDVLVTTAGTIGKMAVAGRAMFCNQAVQALRFRADVVLPMYGYYYLRFQRPVLMQLANVVTIPNVPKRKLQSMVIHYPPIETQKRIIRQMQVAETLCKRADALQTLLKDYIYSLTAKEAHRTGYLPLGKLLSEPPLTGLRAKSSSTGNGFPLVNGLGSTTGRLDTLEDYPRVRASEQQIKRYQLRTGDLLLRKMASDTEKSAVLVGELEETALVGANLIRLRLRPEYSPAFLLAWLLGPGGSRLFTGSLIQSRNLEQYHVPVLDNPRRFEKQFECCLVLLEKAAQFSREVEAFCDVFLTGMFSQGLETDLLAKGTLLDGVSRADPTRLTEQMRGFLGQMSQFQQELYWTLLKMGTGQPVHMLMKQTRTAFRKPGRASGIQGALSTMALLEQFGLAERESPQKILVRQHGMEGISQEAGELSYIMDHNGQPVFIETYKPTEDIFEENEHAAGASERSKL